MISQSIYHSPLAAQVVGDSLMRQLYSRLVHMMRGHSRVVDYKMHTHAAYAVCEVRGLGYPLALTAILYL